MATREEREDHERSAAGMDFDFPVREKASQLGSKLAEEGPQAVFEEIENLLPESWRDQIKTFPIAAVILGFGVGIWLGMKKGDEVIAAVILGVGVGVWLGMRKGDEVIAAATSLATSAAMANVNKAMERFGGE